MWDLDIHARNANHNLSWMNTWMCFATDVAFLRQGLQPAAARCQRPGGRALAWACRANAKLTAILSGYYSVLTLWDNSYHNKFTDDSDFIQTCQPGIRVIKRTVDIWGANHAYCVVADHWGRGDSQKRETLQYRKKAGETGQRQRGS